MATKYKPLLTVKEKTETEPAEFIELCTSPCGDGAEVSVSNPPDSNIPVSGSLTISEGSITIDLGQELEALSTFNETGVIARTGVGSYAGRALEAGNSISISNGDGVAGNPVISISSIPVSNITFNSNIDFGGFDLTNIGNIESQNIKTPILETTSLMNYVSPSEAIVVANPLDMRGSIIKDVAEPVNGSDAATKSYVDNNGGGDITLTGAVLGNGSGTIETTLNMDQSLTGNDLNVNWPEDNTSENYTTTYYKMNHDTSAAVRTNYQKWLYRGTHFQTDVFVNHTYEDSGVTIDQHLVEQTFLYDEFVGKSLVHKKQGESDTIVYTVTSGEEHREPRFDLYVPLHVFGKITVNEDVICFTAPTQNYHLANKQYVDSKAGGALVGEYKYIARDDAPDGWLKCDGSDVNQSDYPELYNLLGIKFGQSEEFYQFKLPDLRGKVALGATPTEAIGQDVGSNSINLTTNQIPSHTHSISVQGRAAYSGSGSRRYIKCGTRPDNAIYYGAGGSGTTRGYDSRNGESFAALDSASTHTHTATASNTGSGSAIDIRQAGLVAGNWFIKY